MSEEARRTPDEVDAPDAKRPRLDLASEETGATEATPKETSGLTSGLAPNGESNGGDAKPTDAQMTDVPPESQQAEISGEASVEDQKQAAESGSEHQNAKEGSGDTKDAKEAQDSKDSEKDSKGQSESKSESKPESKPESIDEAKPKEEPEANHEDEELTPLERAKRAADGARISMLAELDPPEEPLKGSELPKHQHKYSLSAIRAIKRLKDAVPFLQPVDPIAQGVPQYFEYIKNPMDLGTMEKKLQNNKYDTVRELVDDFNLVITNCIYFNGEEALISKMALSIAQSFTKQLSNMPMWNDSTKKPGQNLAAVHPATVVTPAAATVGAAGDPTNSSAILDGEPAEDQKRTMRASTNATSTAQANVVPMIRRKSTADGRPKREIRPPRPRDLTYEQRPRNKKFAAELRFCGHILKEFQSRKLESVAWPFLLPVDPIEQGVPTYFDVIKEPMDLSTMQRKLNEGVYYNADEFEADMRLMFRNCYTFNPEGTPVNTMGHKLEEIFDQRWVDKPDPAPTPPPVDVDHTDDSELDEEYMDSGISNPAIDVLEEQVRMMRRQLSRLKRDSLQEWRDKRGKRKRPFGTSTGTAGHSRRATHSSHGSISRREDPPITYEQKKELSERIMTLPEKKLQMVLKIIQETMPDLRNQGEEIELDMDKMDPRTLRKLFNYVVLQRREHSGSGAPPSGLSGAGSGSGAGTAGTGESTSSHVSHAGSPNGTGNFDEGGAGVPKKRKSKPLSEEEHNRQIEEIQQKLRQFDAASKGVPSTSSAPVGGALNGLADSSSDEDEAPGMLAHSSDDSSSEEE